MVVVAILFIPKSKRLAFQNCVNCGYNQEFPLNIFPILLPYNFNEYLLNNFTAEIRNFWFIFKSRLVKSK